MSFASRDAPREEIERLAVVSRFSYQRRVAPMVSGGVVFRPHPSGRWSPRFFAGVTNHRFREIRRVVPIRLPEGVDADRRRSIQPYEERHVRNQGALTFGASLALSVTSHVTIEPALRFDYGSVGDRIDNAMRSSVRLLWSF